MLCQNKQGVRQLNVKHMHVAYSHILKKTHLITWIKKCNYQYYSKLKFASSCKVKIYSQRYTVTVV